MNVDGSSAEKSGDGRGRPAQRSALRAHGHRLPRINLLPGDEEPAIECTVDFLCRIFTGSCRDAGFDLDGSLQSLFELDRIGASLASPAKQSSAVETELENYVHGAGAYFGKVILDHYGGSWVRDDSGQLHIVGLADLVVQPFHVAASQAREGGSLFSALVAGIRDSLGAPADRAGGEHPDSGGRV